MPFQSQLRDQPSWTIGLELVVAAREECCDMGWMATLTISDLSCCYWLDLTQSGLND